jgi:protease-4
VSRGRRIGRAIIAVAVVVIAVVAGWLLFLWYPTDLAEVLGVVLLIALAVVIGRQAGQIADSLVPGYNVAEVAVEGPITRDGGGSGLAPSPMGAAADDIVEQIEAADEDRGADALVVTLNTPGGAVVPSEDIRLAVEAFDGPTVAHAIDVCASGGYDIAAGAEDFWAREGSIVGSIGVIGSRVTAADLVEDLGLSYEQLTAGEYKDAGVPLREMDPKEREYLQGLVDDTYDHFVETVADRRDLDEATIRDTEARIYRGEEAAELGLVDDLGPRDDVEAHLEERLGETVSVREFTPTRGLADRLGAGARHVAYALGAGVAATLVGDDRELELR